jgi:hypothetical protein
MIVVATLLCDLKAASAFVGPPAMLRLEGDCTFYVNIETEHRTGWAASREWMAASGRPFAWDIWSRSSSWSVRSERDQDSSRLEPICVARNMARAYALATGATHLLFVDADVVVKPDGLQRLLALKVPLCGGLVPGRGAHAGRAVYVFGERSRSGSLINCAHGTLGYCLIRRDLFEVVPFRWGPHPIERGVMLSEDPAFAADAQLHYGAEWIIDTTVTAEHVDDPAKPLTWDQASNEYKVYEHG